MKREFWRLPLSSSHHAGCKIKFQFLYMYLHIIFILFFSVIREDSTRIKFGDDVLQPSP